MGRRPNPVLVEFFDRGAKLEDSSNRYQHTCKRCGELFPKGRVDSLTAHLLRRCANVTQDDRQWVFQQIQQNPDSRQNSYKGQPVIGLPPHIRLEDLQSEIALPNVQQPSALDTLAEVSRRHLDYSSQQGQLTQDHESSARTVSEAVAEQTLLAKLQQSGIDYSLDATAESTRSYSYPAVPAPDQSEHNPDFPLVTTCGLGVSPLVQTASAANQQLEQQAQNRSLVDPQLDDMGGPVQATTAPVYQNDQSDASMMSWNPSIGQDAQHTFGDFAMPSDQPSGFGVLQNHAKSKKRSRFNDTRRLEVSDIRKRGACIRCRMLKKPCSGETPCSTCRSVESARLWKATCVRARLADGFTLWSANLFYSRAKIEVSAAIQGLQQQSLPGRIEARFFAGSSLCLCFAAKSCSNLSAVVDPNLGGGDRDSQSDYNTIWLLDESEAITDKIEEYANQIVNSYIEAEPSLFMRSSLERAQILVCAEEAEEAGKAAEAQEQEAPRSCYNLQNQLLRNVVELWVLTRLLTSATGEILHLQHDAAKSARHLSEPVEWASENPGSSAQSIPESSQSYRLIMVQLLAAVESRCSKLSKVITNELERRLLRRQQVSRFATYLSAVILLNGVERMTGLYKTFDGHEQGHANSHVQQQHNDSTDQQHEGQSSHPAVQTAWGVTAFSLTNRPASWPLDEPPVKLWNQGEHFADLLTMLLRMRALPPKTIRSPDGTLVTLQDYSLPVHVNGRPVREQIDDQTKTAAAWLDPMKLQVDELILKRDGPLPEKEDGIEAWNMRFVTKVLLPEKMK